MHYTVDCLLLHFTRPFTPKVLGIGAVSGRVDEICVCAESVYADYAEVARSFFANPDRALSKNYLT